MEGLIFGILRYSCFISGTENRILGLKCNKIM